jgi:hypothetical protein
LAGLLWLKPNASAQDTNFWIFLCFGQSNMEGFPGIEEQDKSGVDSRFQVFATVDFPELERKKGNWYPAVPPLGRPFTGLCLAESDESKRANSTSLRNRLTQLFNAPLRNDRCEH